MTKTSQTHPLRIDAVETRPSGGKIGITFAPGKKDGAAFNGPWARDLDTDLDAIAKWGAKALVTLIESDEMNLLGIRSLGEKAQQRGIEWLHHPIRDVSVPDGAFEAEWPDLARRLLALLDAGCNIVIHCRGGLGRAGMISARLLVEAGERADTAIAQVRAARPGAIETKAQEAWVASGPKLLGS